MSHSPEDVLAILADRKPSLLIGIEESAQVDFKSEPYDLTTNKGKWELGKDVAGMTNFAGGLIVVGVFTVKTGRQFQRDRLGAVPSGEEEPQRQAVSRRHPEHGPPRGQVRVRVP